MHKSALYATQVRLSGLSPRDLLRLEAGLSLHNLEQHTTPIEASSHARH
jgi:glycine cleavage system aminomethyltransferase T